MHIGSCCSCVRPPVVSAYSWHSLALELHGLSIGGVRRRGWRAMLADSPVALSFPGCLIAAQQKWLRATQTPVGSITLARRKSGHKADLALARLLEVRRCMRRRPPCSE